MCIGSDTREDSEEVSEDTFVRRPKNFKIWPAAIRQFRNDRAFEFRELERAIYHQHYPPGEMYRLPLNVGGREYRWEPGDRMGDFTLFGPDNRAVLTENTI